MKNRIYLRHTGTPSILSIIGSRYSLVANFKEDPLNDPQRTFSIDLTDLFHRNFIEEGEPVQTTLNGFQRGKGASFNVTKEELDLCYQAMMVMERNSGINFLGVKKALRAAKDYKPANWFDKMRLRLGSGLHPDIIDSDISYSKLEKAATLEMPVIDVKGIVQLIVGDPNITDELSTIKTRGAQGYPIGAPRVAYYPLPIGIKQNMDSEMRYVLAGLKEPKDLDISEISVIEVLEKNYAVQAIQPVGPKDEIFMVYDRNGEIADATGKVIEVMTLNSSGLRVSDYEGRGLPASAFNMLVKGGFMDTIKERMGNIGATHALVGEPKFFEENPMMGTYAFPVSLLKE